METNLARDLMSDEDWAFHERFILAVRAPNGRKPKDHRLVLDGIFDLVMVENLPEHSVLLADRGYDSDNIRVVSTRSSVRTYESCDCSFKQQHDK